MYEIVKRGSVRNSFRTYYSARDISALGTIQLEYDNFRRDHMEIEIGKSVDAEVFIAMFDGEEYIEKIPADADSINSYVSRFYS